jgi:hypothetical protein
MRSELPDVRDGLTRIERVILTELERAERERGRRPVPTALLYGRVVERVDLSVAEFQDILGRLAGRVGRRVDRLSLRDLAGEL